MEPNEKPDFLNDPNLMPDHGFDGIRELDNPPPPWLVWIFYITIIFSIFYMVHYHVYKTGKTQDEEYLAEIDKANAAIAQPVAVAQTASPATIPTQVSAQLTDAGSLATGKALFSSKACFTCHGLNGEGNNVGPNLTDEYWIHGGGFDNLKKSVSGGFLQKGMPVFSQQMSDQEINQVVSYVMSLQGTNPANAKAPQGDKYTGK